MKKPEEEKKCQSCKNARFKFIPGMNDTDWWCSKIRTPNKINHSPVCVCGEPYYWNSKWNKAEFCIRNPAKFYCSLYHKGKPKNMYKENK